MANSAIHVDQTGVVVPKPPSPKVIKALSESRDGFARVLIGGSVLLLLAAAYIASIFFAEKTPNELLVVLGSGMGFLLGGRGERNVAE